MIAIIDYGMGNVASVQKALKFIGKESVVTQDHTLIKNSEAIVLPGVGSFLQGMKNLNERGLVEILNEEVIENKKKFLGICLGMQLLIERGTEPVESKGLGWIKGSVVKFNTSDLRIPHMGWNNIKILQTSYFENLDNQDFYFIHSYHMVPDEKEVVTATVNYGMDVVASVQKGNIFATQFHPEKSQESGINLLKNFFN